MNTLLAYTYSWAPMILIFTTNDFHNENFSPVLYVATLTTYLFVIFIAKFTLFIHS